MGKKKIAYSDRDYAQKMKSQWVKAEGLSKRKDHSAAVVRYATAVEIALNLAITRKFKEIFSVIDDSQQEQADEFLDSILMRANGANGKVAVLKSLCETEKSKKSQQRQENKISRHRQH
jgi:hypothetical protein